jgi:ABC-type sugar transport system permease subunit
MKTIRRQRLQETMLAYSLLLPSLVIVVGVSVYPVVNTFWLSLHKTSFLMSKPTFVGFRNYLEAIADKEILSALGLTGYFTVASLTFQTVVAMALALLLNQEFRGRNFVRAIVIIPWAIPTIANAMLWEWIYHPAYGALNGLLHQLGIVSDYVNWLGEPWRALNMVILADSWKMIPLSVLMFLTGLQTVPSELYEAAEIDGATVWQRFLRITLPHLKPTLLIVLILRTIQAFRVFDIVYILTQGGPAGGTMMISFYIYRQIFEYMDFGMGSTLAFITAVIVIGVSALYARVISEDI